MDYVRLGSAGLRVSRLCLGMMGFGDRRWQPWVLDQDAAWPIVRHAVDAGVTFFDTANIYSYGASEEITGRLLSEFFPRREDYVLATKVCAKTGAGPNDRGLSRKHICAAVEDSLRRLKTDYVDLYQVHRWDPATPIEETMTALDHLVRCGKVRYVGACNMFAWQFAKAQHVADRRGLSPFISIQNHYNLLYREEEREMIPMCIDAGIGILPWSPLAQGWLTGSRGRDGVRQTTRGRTDGFADNLYDNDDFDIVDDLEQVARDRQLPPAQIALAWLLQKPEVTAPVIGTPRLAHLEDALAALDVGLVEEEIATLEHRYRPHAVRGHG